MSDSYAASGFNALAASPGQTLLALIASTSTRARLKSLTIAAQDPMADNSAGYVVRRFTAAGTGSGVTEGEADEAGPAPQLSAEDQQTVEPTYAGGVLLGTNLHLRSTLVFYANDGKGWLVPAVAASGIGVAGSHATLTNDVDATFEWEE